jgi:hypothetical protein
MECLLQCLGERELGGKFEEAKIERRREVVGICAMAGVLAAVFTVVNYALRVRGLSKAFSG